MISEKLLHARAYEEQNMQSADHERPMFHVTGGIGWINDPNGFSVYKGEYHLFHQYHPYSVEWGPMHWGHLKTKDFIRWERLPVALAPDQEYDKDGCYSGNAIQLKNGKHMIMYTGVEKRMDEDGICHEWQRQCVAFGDGVEYEKYEGNPVISQNQLPKGAYAADFRDPKLWQQGEVYYALAANRHEDGSGALLLYKSEDGLHWDYVNTMAQCRYEYGTMWECPDYFRLADTDVLIISPMEMEPVDHEFHPGHGVIAFLGTADLSKGYFDRKKVQAIDHGLDFYAPQTIESLDGRRIMIGWMRNWATTSCKKAGARLYGAMTLPREVSLVDGHLLQNPVRELENYRTKSVRHEQVNVNGEVSLTGVQGRMFDMLLKITSPEKGNYSSFTVKLGAKGKHYASIRYDQKDNLIIIDRTHAGGCYDIVHTRTFRVEDRQGQIDMRIIMDGDSVELFVNGGQQAATFILYNDIMEDGIFFEADGNALLSVEKYDIEVSLRL